MRQKLLEMVKVTDPKKILFGEIWKMNQLWSETVKTLIFINFSNEVKKCMFLALAKGSRTKKVKGRAIKEKRTFFWTFLFQER